MMKIHTKKMLPADAGSFKQKEAELSGEYDWKVLFIQMSSFHTHFKPGGRVSISLLDLGAAATSSLQR